MVQGKDTPYYVTERNGEGLQLEVYIDFYKLNRINRWWQYAYNN
jgi:hypothetical protein